MGLLSFTKKSRKQGQSNHTSSKQAFTLAPHIPSQVENNYTSLFPLPISRNYDIMDSSVPKQLEMSLMDDIMNELDSVKSIKKSSSVVKPDCKRGIKCYYFYYSVL